MIYVSKNGGSDHQITLSKFVNIHTKNGIVEGFFGWPAIHVRGTGTKEVTPNIDNIFIDVGALKKSDVGKMGIEIGDVITYNDQFKTMNNKFYTGKALDNKIGGYILTQIAKTIKDSGYQLPYSLYLVNSVQEEVGLRGARMMVDKIKPNAAFVIDVTHDTTTPLMSKMKRGDIKCGRGPVISIGPTVQQKMVKLLLDTAEQNKIKIQRKATGRSTGTDAESFSIYGVPTALVSLPLKYMHTTVESVRIKDVKYTKELLINTLKNINYNHNFNYLNV
jgi:putative aminopeptidase FrvX